MSQRTVVTLLDDLARAEGRDVVAAETVRFSLDGSGYEVDVTKANARRLRRILGPYADAASRRVVGDHVVVRRGHAQRRPTESGDDPADIRQWAKENGYEVADRGRISAEIRAAYKTAN